MKIFSTNRDLLTYEPLIFSELTLYSAIKTQGDNATITNSTGQSVLEQSNADFLKADVRAGDILRIENLESRSCSCEIIEVIDSNKISISLLRENIESQNIIVPNGEDLKYSVISYNMYGYETAWEIVAMLGLGPAVTGAKNSVDDIVGINTLKQASIFGVLRLIFMGMIDGNGISEMADAKMKYYEKRFKILMQRCRIFIDRNGDGKPERIISGSEMKLNRE